MLLLCTDLKGIEFKKGLDRIMRNKSHSNFKKKKCDKTLMPTQLELTFYKFSKRIMDASYKLSDCLKKLWL